jgi:hypothetical protein
MPTFTCIKELPDHKAPDEPFMTKHMHQATPLQSSPFLSVQTSPYIDSTSKFPRKTPTVPERHAATRSISPCFSTLSDTKTFYSAIDVTDIYMPEGVSSTVTELKCTTPDSDITMERDCPFTEEPEKEDPISGQPSRMQDDSTVDRQFRLQPTKQRSSLSHGSSISKRDRRSMSQSTGNRSSSSYRRSSKHKPRRIPTDHSETLTGSPNRSSYSAMSRQRHQDLLSLHQNSCRLFQSSELVQGSHEHVNGPLRRADSSRQEDRQRDCRFSYPAISSHTRSYSTPTRNFTNSTAANSLAHSSLLNSYGIYLAPHLAPESEVEREAYPNGTGSTYEPSAKDRPLSGPEHYHQENVTSTHQPIPATIIDWTSPSTRKREYEKIDRSYRGIRGFWRRFAPQFCQPGDRRTPFFEEGKRGNGVYGGSVRRFRMDFSDDYDEELDEQVTIHTKTENDTTCQNLHGDTVTKDARLRDARGRRKWRGLKFR